MYRKLCYVDVRAKGTCLSTIGPFVIWKGDFSQAAFSQGDTAFSEFVCSNKQVLRKGTSIYYTLHCRACQ